MHKSIHNMINKVTSAELKAHQIYIDKLQGSLGDRINIIKEEVMAKDKVILAYSGGLDTTAIIPWLKENFDYEVVCVCIDCGQEEELDGLEERATS